MNNSPYVFPQTEFNYAAHPDFNGLMMRDYFAGQALISILSTLTADNIRFSFESTVPQLAYMYADAMLKAREDKTNKI